MKLPKTVVIASYEYTILQDKSLAGAFFNTEKKTITIGTKYPEYILEFFLHEVIESLMTERNLRFDTYQGTNDRRLFNFFHYEFEQLVKDLSIALKEVMK